MYPHDQDVFVVRAIEDDNFALARHLRFHPPQEVMRQFFRARFFEVRHIAAIGIHRTDDVLDYTVLAGGIEALQAHKHRALAFGEKALLQLTDLFAKFADPRESVFLVSLSVVVGVEIRKMHLLAWRDTIAVDVALALHCFSIAAVYSPSLAATLHLAR